MTTTLLGSATRSVADLNAWLKSNGCPEYADLFRSAGVKYGVRWDLAVFQSVHETNYFRFGNDVKKEQNNFGGLGARGGGAPGDSFATPALGIEAQIQTLALRAGVRTPKADIISPYVKSNYDYILGLNLKTWEDLTNTYATDGTYTKKIFGIVAKFDAIYKEKVMANATWFGIGKDANGHFVQALAGGDGAVQTVTTNSVADLIKTLQQHESTARTWQPLPVRSAPFLVKPDPKPEPKPDPKPGSLAKFKVLIDPGHCEMRTGARGKNPSVQEEDLNRLQAETLKAELIDLGVGTVDIYDPKVDDLMAIGRRAQGYHIFISLHLNAYANKEFYTCAMCHATLQKPNSRSATVASAFAKAVAKSINNPLFSGSRGWPEGVMAAGLSVLNGASQTDCPIFFLSEMEFIDDEISDVGLKKRIPIAMKAGALVLKQALLAL